MKINIFIFLLTILSATAFGQNSNGTVEVETPVVKGDIVYAQRGIYTAKKCILVANRTGQDIEYELSHDNKASYTLERIKFDGEFNYPYEKAFIRLTNLNKDRTPKKIQVFPIMKGHCYCIGRNKNTKLLEVTEPSPEK